MKHLKTLITLFLLVIGASVSWAQSEETSVPARTAIWNWKNGVPSSIFDSARTLSVHMYNLSKEGLHTDESYATAVVLLVLVIAINMLSNFVARKVGKNKYGN